MLRAPESSPIARRYLDRMMRRIRILAVVTLAAVLAAGGPAGAQTRRRPLCAVYRCTTVVQDRLVRVLRADSRRPEDESEAELRHSVDWAVWRPSGHALPLGNLGAHEVRQLTVAGPWVAWAESSCDYESSECAHEVRRLNAQTDRREENTVDLHRVEPPPQPGLGCLIFDSVGEEAGITALVLADSGTIAWIQGTHVCVLPHDAPLEPALSAPGFEGERVPLLLASAPDIAPHSLRLVKGRLYWSEQTVHSAPLA